MARITTIYGLCVDCDTPLPGISAYRFAKNPSRRCMACYRKKVKGSHLSQGYIRIHYGHTKIYEHRLVMERKLGRPLKRSEIVHHINGNRTDNRPENLMLYDNPGRHVLDEGHVVFDSAGRFARGWATK